MIDAAGAIYVIGGSISGGNYGNDVWKSADGGADWSRSRILEGALGGYHGGTGLGELQGYCRGTDGVLRCTKVYQGSPKEYLGVLEGNSRTFRVYPRGTQGAPRGCMNVSGDAIVETRMSCICLGKVLRLCVRVRVSVFERVCVGVFVCVCVFVSVRVLVCL